MIIKIKTLLSNTIFMGYLSIFIGLVGLLAAFGVNLINYIYSSRSTITFILTCLFTLLLLFVLMFINRERVQRILERYLSFWRVSGISKFFPRRDNLKLADWERFFSSPNNPKNIIIMRQALSQIFENQNLTTSLARHLKSGAEISILFLSPSHTELDQLQNLGKGIEYGDYKEPIDNIRQKILKSYDLLLEKVASATNSAKGRLRVRFATINLPFSLVSIDRKMIVTFYGTEVEADQQPTIRVVGKNSIAYRRFMAEFEKIWQEHSSVQPHLDIVLKQNIKTWKNYIHIKKIDVKTYPAPYQAIIFPTYRCSVNCSYCMFSQARKNRASSPDMKIATFRKILSQLYELGVRRFEISGGGGTFRAC